jgi:hypothetical protein
MTGSNKRTSYRPRPDAEPERQVHPTDDDRFLAAFSAARGTISPALDLDTDLAEPGAAAEDGDAGHQRAGS